MRGYNMIKFTMPVNHDDLLDYESSQGFEINDSTRQRVIGYVKAEIASQAHFYNLQPKFNTASSVVLDGKRKPKSK